MTSGGGANFSYASAIGLFNSVINCTLLVIVNLIARRLGDGEGASLW
jgi:putative aldouronate transport system permease protein